MRHLKTLLTVIGAVTVLVLAGNTVALAATGHGLLLGKSNSEKKVTSLSRTTSGAVLNLHNSNSAGVPLTVNGKGRVTNLNADTVDGKDSSVLGTRALVWTYTGSSGGSTNGWSFFLNGIPVGTYQISYEVYLGSPSTPQNTNYVCNLSIGSIAGIPRKGAESSGSQFSDVGVGVTGTALMTVRSGDGAYLTCHSLSTATWTSTVDQPIRITAVPITSLTNKGSAPLS
jgi:hypothetical protein